MGQACAFASVWCFNNLVAVGMAIGHTCGMPVEEDTTEAGAESAANRKLAGERGMELMRDLLRERQMEDHQKSEDSTNSGYPPGL